MYDKKLIVYFSDSGNTKKLAEMIQAAVGGDIMDIKAPKPDFSAYDLLFLGTPNYPATVAGPMADYIKGIDLTGKTVAPFCTHGMGGLQNVGDDMTKLCTAIAVPCILARSSTLKVTWALAWARWLAEMKVSTMTLPMLSVEAEAFWDRAVSQSV